MKDAPRQTITGNPPSKSNCYQVIKLGQKASLAKSKALKDYEKSFYLQCNHYRNAGIDGLFELHIDVYYPSNKSDLDNSLKATLDCLQQVGAIRNDNTCIRIVAQKFIDKLNPRIEFQIIPV